MTPLALILFVQADISSTLDKVRQRLDVPSIAAAVVENGRIRSAVVGVRELGKPDKALVSDRYATGSLTKGMTALMVFRLIDSGKLKLDQTLSSALPGVPMREEYAKATLRQLLTFRAGIQPYTRVGPRITPFLFELKGTPDEQRLAFAKHVLQEPPVAAPGTKFEYSNASYTLLGVIASRVTGKGWDALIREHVFAPIGMKSAGFGEPRTAHPANVSGHFRSPNGFQPRPIIALDALAPAGHVYCSIDDLARFADASLRIMRGESKLLKPATQKLMASVHPQGDGSIDLGGGGAYTAGIGFWPSRNKAVVVATNGGDSDEVCESVIGELSGQPKPERPRLGIMLEPTPEGIRIADVVAGSRADRAGLKVNDLILEIDGAKVSEETIRERLANAREITVKRGGQTLRIRLDG